MATRMQQRRGTASQWTTANPILAAGEIGFETDTGEFRVGDGVNAWADLSPFKNILDLGGNLDDYVPLTQKGIPTGVATLDADGNVPETQLDIAMGAIQIAESSLNTSIGNVAADLADAETSLTNAIATAKAGAETTAQGYVDTHANDTTNVHGISDTSLLVVTSDSRLSDNRTPSDLSVSTGKIIDGAVTSAKIADGTIVAGDIADGAITSAKILDGTIVNADINSSAAISQSKIENLTTDLAAKAPLASPTFTGTVNAAAVTISGNLTVNGTTTTVSSSSLEITDPMIYMGGGNTGNTVDLGIVSSFNDGTYQHSGIVRDASDSKWKIFKGVTDEPTTTVNFAQGSLDALAVGPLEATTITASGLVTATAAGVAFSDGTQTKQGVPSITSINQQTASYTGVLADRDKLVEINSASATTLTIPTNASVAYPVGTSIDILQTGAGQVTIAGASGVTVNATPGLKLRAQWSSATLFKRATDTWVVFGDLSA